MSNTIIKLGLDMETSTPITADLAKTGHMCVVGGTGSGKSMFILYALYNLLKLLVSVVLYIGDFKKSGDYKGISNNFAEFSDVVSLIDDFYAEFEHTPENSQTIKILLLDEYAGFIVWLAQNNRKKCEEIKGKISNLLMLGRSRHCYVWCIQQRMTAQLFPSGIGAIDNFQILVGLGRLSVDSRRSLFAGEHLENTEFEETYCPKTGEGLCLIDGQPLRAISIPHISDKGKLKILLGQKANLAHDGTDERRRSASK